MSYSFTKRAATRSELIEAVKAEMESIVTQQPMHAKDSAQALVSAQEFLAAVPDPDETKEFCMSVNGSVGWTGGDVITSVGFGVQVWLVPKDAQ